MTSSSSSCPNGPFVFPDLSDGLPKERYEFEFHETIKSYQKGIGEFIQFKAILAHCHSF